MKVIKFLFVLLALYAGGVILTGIFLKFNGLEASRLLRPSLMWPWLWIYSIAVSITGGH